MASSGVKNTNSDKTVGKGGEGGGQVVRLNLNQDTLKDLKKHFIVPVCDLPTKVRKGWKVCYTSVLYVVTIIVHYILYTCGKTFLFYTIGIVYPYK